MFAPPAVDSAEDLPKGTQVDFGESIIVYEQPEGGGYTEQDLADLDHVPYDVQLGDDVQVGHVVLAHTVQRRDSCHTAQ